MISGKGAELRQAARDGDLEFLLSCLPDKELNIDSSDEDGWTALHEAAEEGHDEILLALLKAGADPQLKDSFGNTALHLCCKAGDVRCVKNLIQFGGGLMDPDADGRTPVEIAIEHGHTGVEDVLRERIGRLNASNPGDQSTTHARTRTKSNGGASPESPPPKAGRAASPAVRKASVSAREKKAGSHFVGTYVGNVAIARPSVFHELGDHDFDELVELFRRRTSMTSHSGVIRFSEFHKLLELCSLPPCPKLDSRGIDILLAGVVSKGRAGGPGIQASSLDANEFLGAIARVAEVCVDARMPEFHHCSLSTAVKELTNRYILTAGKRWVPDLARSVDISLHETSKVAKKKETVDDHAREAKAETLDLNWTKADGACDLRLLTDEVMETLKRLYSYYSDIELTEEQKRQSGDRWNVPTMSMAEFYRFLGDCYLPRGCIVPAQLDHLIRQVTRASHLPVPIRFTEFGVLCWCISVRLYPLSDPPTAIMRLIQDNVNRLQPDDRADGTNVGDLDLMKARNPKKPLSAVKKLLLANRDVLKAVFDFYAKRELLMGSRNGGWAEVEMANSSLSLAEFRAFCNDYELFPEILNQLDVRKVFFAGNRAESVADDNIGDLSFKEYTVCLIALAKLVSKRCCRRCPVLTSRPEVAGSQPQSTGRRSTASRYACLLDMTCCRQCSLDVADLLCHACRSYSLQRKPISELPGFEDQLRSFCETCRKVALKNEDVFDPSPPSIARRLRALFLRMQSSKRKKIHLTFRLTPARSKPCPPNVSGLRPKEERTARSRKADGGKTSKASAKGKNQLGGGVDDDDDFFGDLEARHAGGDRKKIGGNKSATPKPEEEPDAVAATLALAESLSKGQKGEKGEAKAKSALLQEMQRGAEEGDVAAVQRCFKKGCNSPQHLWRALLVAAEYGHIHVARFLLTAGADVEGRDGDGNTCLHWAAAWGDVAHCRLFLTAGADVNAQDNEGWTALHLCSHHHHLEVARLLVSSGADSAIRNEEQRTALDIARDEDYLPIIQLIEGVDLGERSPGLFGPRDDVDPTGLQASYQDKFGSLYENARANTPEIRSVVPTFPQPSTPPPQHSHSRPRKQSQSQSQRRSASARQGAESPYVAMATMSDAAPGGQDGNVLDLLRSELDAVKKREVLISRFLDAELSKGDIASTPVRGDGGSGRVGEGAAGRRRRVAGDAASMDSEPAIAFPWARPPGARAHTAWGVERTASAGSYGEDDGLFRRRPRPGTAARKARPVQKDMAKPWYLPRAMASLKQYGLNCGGDDAESFPLRYDPKARKKQEKLKKKIEQFHQKKLEMQALEQEREAKLKQKEESRYRKLRKEALMMAIKIKEDREKHASTMEEYEQSKQLEEKERRRDEREFKRLRQFFGIPVDELRASAIDALHITAGSGGAGGGAGMGKGARVDEEKRAVVGRREALALGKLLKMNRSLRELHFWVSRIEDAGGVSVVKGIKGNTSLTSLSIMDNYLGDESALVLAEFLKGNQTLRELNLGGNEIRAHGGAAIFMALKDNPMLQLLNLSGNCLGQKELSEVGRSQAAHGMHMAEEGHSGSATGQADADRIRERISSDVLLHSMWVGLRDNKTLREISVEGNSLSPKQIAAFLCALGPDGDEPCKSVLESVDVELDVVSPADGRAIGRALCSNPHIARLSGVHISMLKDGTAGCVLGQPLASGAAPETVGSVVDLSVWCGGNAITEGHVAIAALLLAQAAASRFEKKEIPLDLEFGDCPIGIVGSCAIAELLRLSIRTRRLDVKSGRIPAMACCALLQAIRTNPAAPLRSLNMSYNVMAGLVVPSEAQEALNALGKASAPVHANPSNTGPGKGLRKLDLHLETVKKCAAASSLRTLAVGPAGVLAIASGSAVQLWHPHAHDAPHLQWAADAGVHALSFDAQGLFLACGCQAATEGGSGVVVVLGLSRSNSGEIVDLKEVMRFSLEHTKPLTDVGVESTGVWGGSLEFRLVVASAEGVFVVSCTPLGGDLESAASAGVKTKVVPFSAHDCCVNVCCLSSTGHTAFTGDVDGIVRVWNTRTITEEATFDCDYESVDHLALSPSGEFLAAVHGEAAVRLWRVQTREQLLALSAEQLGFTQGDGSALVSGVCFDPAGGSLVVSSASGAVCAVHGPMDDDTDGFVPLESLNTEEWQTVEVTAIRRSKADTSPASLLRALPQRAGTHQLLVLGSPSHAIQICHLRQDVTWQPSPDPDPPAMVPAAPIAPSNLVHGHGDGVGAQLGRDLWLALRWCGSGSTGVTAVGGLRELRLEGCDVGDPGAVVVAAALAANVTQGSSTEMCRLTTLVLSHCDITAQGAESLFCVLEHPGVRSVTKLDLSFNDFSAASLVTRLGGLLSSSSLTWMSLRGCRLGPASGTAIAVGLAKNEPLRDLDLAENRLGDEGLAAFGSALAQNHALRRLVLSSNGIATPGGRALSEGLTSNVTLTELCLDNNILTTETALVLGEALLKNNSLQYLNLQHNTRDLLNIPLGHNGSELYEQISRKGACRVLFGGTAN